MINAPVPPDTLVTRQITCICCQEQFTVSVDEPNRRSPGRRAQSWHVPVDQPAYTRLRYEDDCHQRTIIPAPRAAPMLNPEERPHRDPFQYYFVYCPRCGADNSNWLNFMRQPRPYQQWVWLGYMVVILAVGLTLYFLFDPRSLKHSLPLLVTVGLAGMVPLLLIPGMWYEARLRRYLSETLPALKGELSPPQLRAGLTLLVLAVLLPTVLYVGIPIAARVKNRILNPQPTATLVSRLDDVSAQMSRLNALNSDAQQPVNNAFAGLRMLLNTELRSCEKAQIDQMIYTLQGISAATPHGNALLVQSAIHQLQIMRETPVSVCRADMIESVGLTLAPERNDSQGLPNEPIYGQCQYQWQAANAGKSVQVEPACYNFMIAAVLGSLESMQTAPAPYPADSSREEILSGVRLLALNPAMLPHTRYQIQVNVGTLERVIQAQQPPEPPLIDFRFLLVWFTAVFLTWLATTICAFLALYQRIDWLDPHVPRPLFISIANMTRVAVWEANHTLEIGSTIDRIQWTRARRNENGGIDLVGLFRDPPDISSEGMVSNLVRAQQYFISTDIWCRIRQARVLDVMVPRPAGGPTFALPGTSPIQVVVSDRLR